MRASSFECECGMIPCVCIIHEVNTDIVVDDQSNNESFNLFGDSIMKSCSSCCLIPCICCERVNSPIQFKKNDCNKSHSESEDGIQICQLDTLNLPKHVMDHINSNLQKNTDEENVDMCGRVPLPFTNSKYDSAEESYYIAKELARVLKPHQIEGIKFMSNCLDKDNGCLLADYMGLGKTLQVISVIHRTITEGIILNETKKRRTLVVCPTICLSNWENEIKKWLSPKSLELCPYYKLKQTSSSSETSWESRIQSLLSWEASGGILLLGYEMFRLLVNPISRTNKAQQTLDVCTHGTTALLYYSNLAQEKEAKLNDQLSQLLCYPGPDLVVLDEGHRMKDPQSLLCQSLKKITTPKRLVLSGYPLQNCLSEYWCMIDFCRPNFLGDYPSFRSTYENPLIQGSETESRKAARNLAEKLKSVVLRRDDSILRNVLPVKKEFVIFCKMSELQTNLYHACLEARDTLNDGIIDRGVLSVYSNLLHIINHPDIIHDQLNQYEKERESLYSMLEPSKSRLKNDGWEATYTPNESKRQKLQNRSMVLSSVKKLEDKDRHEWARDIMSFHRSGISEYSGKMMVLMTLLKACQENDEKVLLFSQSVQTLNCIGSMLQKHYNIWNPLKKSTKEDSVTVPKRRSKRDPANLTRRKRISRTVRTDTSRSTVESTKKPLYSYFQIDGRTTMSKRAEYIEMFNDIKDSSKTVNLLLLSTKAASEGLNLHVANRVILFDVNWNPCLDHQSMCRSHRFGQTKPVFVYRFVCDGTIEKKIYDQQLTKIGLSNSVVDDLGLVMNKQTIDREFESFFDIPPEYITYQEKDYENDKKNLSNLNIGDSVLESVLNVTRKYMTSLEDRS